MRREVVAEAGGGGIMPRPPRQDDEWRRPRTRLSEELLTATELLFQQGLADPRGCTYRRIELVVGNVRSIGGEVVATRGWVLPPDPDVAGTFAVCWNGLVYPVASVGEEVDLRSEMAAIIASKGRAQEEWVNQRYLRGRGVIHEDEAVAHVTLRPIKACLLLRLGETRLAEAYWEELGSGVEAAQVADPYLSLAIEWAWYGFDRAVCAHMRGDHRLSLATAEVVAGASPQIEASAARRGFERPRVFDSGWGRERREVAYLGFLKPLAVLLADQERRVGAKDQPLPLHKAMSLPGKRERVDALIRCLEDVAERQRSQPGAVVLYDNLVVRALEIEGKEAIEPLLECLEHDPRLTRSVSFGRDFHGGRNLIPVHRAAQAALENILGVRVLGRDRHNVAAAMRRVVESKQR